MTEDGALRHPCALSDLGGTWQANRLRRSFSDDLEDGIDNGLVVASRAEPSSVGLLVRDRLGRRSSRR